MTALDAVRSQRAAVNALRRALDCGKLSSAYLFHGPSGVGKELAAVALATDVLEHGHPSVSKERIATGNHPDVRVFRPREEGKRNLQVEVLRTEILPLAQFAPFEAKATFFIFPEADISFPEFQPEAANALLKTLEEPRPNIHFILTTERPNALLPTIRSRCQGIRFGRLPPSLLRDILGAEGIEPDAMGPAIALSAGRADVALAMCRDGAVEALTNLVQEVDDAVHGSAPGVVVDAAEQLARWDDLELALQALQNFYRDIAVTSLQGADAQLGFCDLEADLRRRATSLSPTAAATRVSLIQECAVQIRQNANRQVALDALLFELRSAR